MGYGIHEMFHDKFGYQGFFTSIGTFHLKTEITRHTFIPCMCVALIIYTNK